MKVDLFSDDILDFLRCLEKFKVRYLVVGGEAVIYYGNPRLTGDIDFFYEPSTNNSNKLYSALLEFWSGNIPGVSKFNELQEEGVIFQFGAPPNRIDLINNIDGVGFKEAWNNRETVNLELGDTKIPVFYIGIDQLIKNKESAARFKDQEDLKYLKRARENRR